MKAFVKLAVAVSFCFVIGGGVASHAVAATLKQQIVGTWTVVSSINERAGKKTEPLGPHPIGYYMFDQEGHYSL
jgi:hypothetical protein